MPDPGNQLKADRHEAIAKLRSERYEWAKKVDPEAVAAFNAKAQAEINKSR
jgi:hypothetical protein